MTPYRHTQFSVLNMILLGLPMIWTVWGGLFLGIPSPFNFLVLGLGIFFLGLAICFYSLKIEVDQESIRMAFGPGLFKKSWQLAGCTAVRQVRTRFIDGWGIKLTRDGWLYSVSMPHAVLVRLENGKAFILGTDEPEALLAALLEAGLELEDEPA